MQKCGMTEDTARRHTVLLDGQEYLRLNYRLEKSDWVALETGRSR
jgi:RimJ/RimL family protein N-acetyltransferase